MLQLKYKPFFRVDFQTKQSAKTMKFVQSPKSLLEKTCMILDVYQMCTKRKKKLRTQCTPLHLNYTCSKNGLGFKKSSRERCFKILNIPNSQNKCFASQNKHQIDRAYFSFTQKILLTHLIFICSAFVITSAVTS